MALSGIDVHHVVRELSELQNSAKIDQIYVYDNKHLIIRFYVRSKGKRYLRIELPNMMYLSDHNPPTPKIPPGVTLHLRKILGGAQLIKVEQLGLERTLVLTVIKSQQERKIVVELFDRGNVIVTENNIIKSCLEQQSWANRIIRPGKEYVPVTRELIFTQHSIDMFLEQLDEEDTVSKALATKAGLGGKYAKEICVRAQMDPQHNAKQLTREQWEYIQNKAKSLLEPSKGYIYFKDSVPEKISSKDIDTVSPIVLEHKQKPKTEYASFNEALNAAYGGKKIEENHEKHEQLSRKELTKTEKILLQMDAQEKQLNKTMEESSAVGEYIYENYQQIDELLRIIRSLEKDGNTDKIKEQFPKLTYNGGQRTISFSR